MKEKIALDQSKLIGFRIQAKAVGGGVAKLGAKLGGKIGKKV